MHPEIKLVPEFYKPQILKIIRNFICKIGFVQTSGYQINSLINSFDLVVKVTDMSKKSLLMQ